MRSAKENTEFPYTSNTVCYFEVDNEGNVSRLYHKNKDQGQTYMNIVKAISNVEVGKSKIYTVWPGRYSSDIFIIDDLELFDENMRRKLW